MTPAVSIVPITVSELHTLQDIALNAYGDHYLHLWNDGGAWYIERSFSDAALKGELEDPNAAFFLIHADDELVGFLKLNVNKELEGYTSEGALELERIYLVKSASGHGIGKQVLDFTNQFARERNKRVVWLKAMDSSHDAIRFYERNGYTQCGTYMLDFETMKPEYRGMVVLKLELN
ncbi:GNAT family N-acetyltransferase [Pontibacter sp. KCTC 32443]|uniref:GNAT family N-acetyltransferase n=1 Tax=Pontibacter TaxID=323449 RepID=UPI00164E8B00|nr:MULTISPECIES: GNAT family N-acetyltransferase [Pontibacter]MBC5772467.1 GNAT family N-acetyltransferase [Pontibacter sp. KCTC 32443]